MKKSESPKKIDDCIVRIMRLALQVNRETEHDVFVNFYGHVKSFEISVCYGGWQPPYVDDFKEKFYLDKFTPDRLEQCAKIQAELEKLLNEKNNGKDECTK